jgi:catechol 2,3-dioxygenase-like lactoylglutathione lyase family enzyme
LKIINKHWDIVVVNTIFATTKISTMRKLEFASLQVRDLETSKEFYTTKLGFEEAGIPNPEACIFRYNKGEASFAIRTPIGNLEGKELGIGTSLWFAIDGEIEDLQTRLLANNVTLLGPVKVTPFGKILIAKDPDGYNITFLKSN